MNMNDTPFAAFHSAIRILIDVEDTENGLAEKINKKMALVLNLSKVKGYKIGADGSSVAPALTPKSDQHSYDLLIFHTAQWFVKNDPAKKAQMREIDAKLHTLENGPGS
jgi:hypothetical protein